MKSQTMKSHVMTGRLRKNETAVFIGNLFERHHQEIFAYLYRLLNNREWAHDLTQETFEKVIRHQDQLDGIENHRAWIYRIASNLAFNALKRQKRWQWLPWKQHDAASLTTPDPARQNGQQEAVVQALDTLPSHYRAPLLLFSYYEMSVREIADILEISPGAVKTRLHRAREQFRQVYGEDAHG
jgi:RNA polymerase sigma-70 factor (ECF subfamily)